MKVELASYRGQELAAKWFYQIISFWRIDDAEGFMGDNLGRNWISREEEHVRYFIIYTGDILISHTEVLSKDIEHEGIEYRLYGLGGVMTYPAFRRQGHGRRVVGAATEYLMAQPDVDLALLTCGQHNRGFYEKCGWEFTEVVKIDVGEGEESEELTEAIALRYVSEKARENKAAFERTMIWFGGGMW